MRLASRAASIARAAHRGGRSSTSARPSMIWAKSLAIDRHAARLVTAVAVGTAVCVGRQSSHPGRVARAARLRRTGRPGGNRMRHGQRFPEHRRGPRHRRCRRAGDVRRAILCRSRFAGASDFNPPGSRRQILIDVGDGAVMFTVAAVNGADPDVQIGSAALTRLHLQTPPAASAHVTTNVLSSGDLVETTTLRPGADVAVVAPHGGFIERATDTQARRVSTDERLLANVWICRGRAGDAFRRWHITSDDLSEQSFPGLQALLATRHDYAGLFPRFRRP